MELKEKLKVLEVNAYIYQYDYAAANKAEIEEKINAIVEEMNLRQGKLDQVILDYNNTFEKVNSIDADISGLRDIILNITVQLEKQAGQTNLINEKIQTREQELKRLNEELLKLTENEQGFSQELNSKTSELNLKKNKLTELKQLMEQVSVYYEKLIPNFRKVKTKHKKLNVNFLKH